MTVRQQLQFRQTLRRTGCLAAALAAAGLAPRRRPRRAAGPRAASGRHARPGHEAPQLDLEQAAAALESEAVRRALAGVSLPVFHQGRECGSTTKHSDQLLVFLLKTLRPERYGKTKEGPDQDSGPFVLELDLSAAGEEGEGDGGGRGED